MTQTKECPRCGETKDCSEFIDSIYTRNGWCESCIREFCRQIYESKQYKNHFRNLESDSHNTDFYDEATESQLDDDTPRAGIYIIKKDGMVLYIGESANVDRRIKAHRFAIGGEILFISCGDHKKRLKLEKELIDMFNPLYNSNLPTQDMIITTTLGDIKSYKECHKVHAQA